MPSPSDEADTTWLAQVVIDSAEAAGIGVVVTVARPELSNVYANRAASRMLGHDQRELLRMDPLSFVAQGQLDQVGALAARLSETGRVPESLRLFATHADGSTRALDVSFSPVELPEGPGVVSFLVDVTPQQQAEASLRASEQRFRRAVERVPEAMFITEGTSIRYANPAFSELVGMGSEETAEGRDILDFTDPPGRLRVAQHLQAARAGPVETQHLSLRCRDGVVSVEIRSIAMDYDDATLVLSFGHEVTEQADVKAQLIQADRLAMLGTLAGGMAHAINNPLSYLILNVEHLSRHVPNLASDRDYLTEARVRLAEAHEGANRVASVVKRMRAFSRMQQAEPRRLHVRAVLDDALALVANEIRHRGQLTTHVQDVAEVWGSEGQLEQAFLSLLVHATRSLPEGGSRQGTIQIDLRDGEDGHVWLTCSYDRHESDPATPRSSEGPGPAADRDGIGLVVCQDLVTTLGGHVLLESSAGHREVVHVVLPPADAELRAVQLDAVDQPEPASSESPAACVLVIDDDPGVANALRVLLQDQHDVTSVESGRAGLAQLLEDPRYDVAFCDLVMPDMSGIDLYHALKLNRPGAECKLVFMTGGVFTPDAEQFLAQVPNERIEKPFNLLRVHAILRQFAKTRREVKAPE